MSDANDRLDSWKAISDYLGRDVRTLRRWEEQGLPVRRVGGGRGSSVFAFRSEIDEWLRSGGPERPAEPPRAPVASVSVIRSLEPAAPAEPPPVVPSVPAAVPARRIARVPRRILAAAALFAAIFFGWRTFAPSAAPQQLHVTMTQHGIVATSPSGEEQWRYDFPLDVTEIPNELVGPTRVIGGRRPIVLTLTSYRVTKPGGTPLNGLLRQFNPQGRLQRAFEFNDRWTFAGTSYEGPWAVTDAAVDDSYGRRQIAVSAHHYTWWPSVVTILDDRLQRQSTFVNSGWVDNLRWLSPDQLGIAGFNEALNGGMFAVLSSHDIDGASPESAGTKFICDDCLGGRPQQYFVFPRSELNRVTGSRFNRAFLESAANGVTVRTDEVARENNIGSMVEAVFEFSPDLQLVSASYGDRYWDKHHALELEGKIKHTRAECPERDGPPVVKKWTRETGWVEIRPKR